ncbi:FAD-binding domain-containing protein [Mollisia scopiformis]|uniref:FAD-binding domain-containing protein n=1 Tax=Mollisia scopiformis TaxID=149040 RepID=A0A194WZX8_MOLSC|nr:FAD-binding domain-containing protein [Mollisia scopiformis]KUJ13259.1 FAD-binding domain-containing protein [Mollisia scopiformis]
MSNREGILAGLGPLLSPKASIVLPSDSKFASLAAVESDVQQTVRYASEHNIPFIARAGGHGATKALSQAKNAIQIDFRSLNHIKLSEDGQTATIGGGANVSEIVNTLIGLGKRTVTGICESVGFSAPALGGGHGWLQGQYGLMADQVISARLVLPNGELVTVSENCNSDLFWAIRGAGHNFGLVTEWEYRVYVNSAPSWSWEIFVYSGDKLEALYDLANRSLQGQPPELIYWGYIIKVQEIDPDHPILWFGVIFNGSPNTAKEYAKPFHDIGPLSVQIGQGSIHDLAVATFQDADGPGCAYGMTSLRYPIGLKSHNLTAIRQVYNEIDETFKKVPEISGSFFLLEAYSTQAVKAVGPKSTAFPHREDNILVTSYIMYAPNSAIDHIAHEFGKRLQKYLLEGSEDPAHLRAYVNYANGNESLQEVYGWEAWRLEKLRKLKAQWDPENKMRYYVPIE